MIAALAVAAVAGVVLSARASLDDERLYSARTAELPLFSERANGLVRIPVGDLVFRARVAGMDQAGPALVLLHGFPETSAMWVALIDAAAASGFRVVAFDQRGYSPGARPEAVSDYAVPKLLGDIAAVADTVGFDRFHLVGHDWGCVLGWAFAAANPEQVLSWSALSIPHPGSFAEREGAGPPLYVRVFNTRGLAETLLSFNRLWVMRRAMYADTSDAQRKEYVAAFSEPGAITAALNWYRATFTGAAPTGAETGAIGAPTLFIRGSREMWASDATLARQRPLLTGPYTEITLDAGHWLMEEEPQAVVDAILAHLQAAASGDAPTEDVVH